MRGRNKAMYQQGIVTAWYMARMQSGEAKSIQNYFDELKSDHERFEDSGERMFARLDRLIDKQEREAGKG